MIDAIRDLKGKIVSITAEGSPEHVYISSLVVYVGIEGVTD